jgi:hypothetical protein
MKKLVMAAGAALFALAACGSEENPGGLSAEENRELNNAAEMLDASPDSLIASDEATLGNGEEPSAETGDVLVADPGANGAAGNQQ